MPSSSRRHRSKESHEDDLDLLSSPSFHRSASRPTLHRREDLEAAQPTTSAKGKVWDMRSLPVSSRRRKDGYMPDGNYDQGGTGYDGNEGVYATQDGEMDSRSRGLFRVQNRSGHAPVDQADQDQYSQDDASPAPSSDLEKGNGEAYSSGDEDQQHSRAAQGKKKKPEKRGGAAAGEEGQEGSAGWTQKKKLIVSGGAAVAALVVVIVAVYLYLNRDSSSSSSSLADSEDLEESSSSTGNSASVSGSSNRGGELSAAGSAGATLASNATVVTTSSTPAPSMSVGGGLNGGGSTAAGLESLAAAGTTVPKATNGLSPMSRYFQPTVSLVSQSSQLTSRLLPHFALDTQLAGNPGATFELSVPSATTAIPAIGGHETGVQGKPTTTATGTSSQLAGGTSYSSDDSGDEGASSEDGLTKYITTATWFDSEKSPHACGTTFSSSDYVAALSSAVFGDTSEPSSLCGAYLRVWQPTSNQTITVQVGDVCQDCPSALSLSLSPSAFLALSPFPSSDLLARFNNDKHAGQLDVGVLDVQWWMADSARNGEIRYGFVQEETVGRGAGKMVEAGSGGQSDGEPGVGGGAAVMTI
ncbi:hypothetical protein JCM11251_006798 [Rhodosporidiobolus azoricus]